MSLLIRFFLSLSLVLALESSLSVGPSFFGFCFYSSINVCDIEDANTSASAMSEYFYSGKTS